VPCLPRHALVVRALAVSDVLFTRSSAERGGQAERQRDAPRPDGDPQADLNLDEVT
jgi:hypothetical protein